MGSFAWQSFVIGDSKGVAHYKRQYEAKLLNTATPRTIEQLQKKLLVFRLWLESRGAELLKVTNEWEVLRFRANGQIVVVYKNAQGMLAKSPEAEAAMQGFFQQKPWTASAGKVSRRYGQKSNVVKTLLERDGDSCFLCHQPLGDDASIEHLLALVAGGSNHIANLVLAHKKCNQELGHKPVMLKIKMRESKNVKPAKPSTT